MRFLTAQQIPVLQTLRVWSLYNRSRRVGQFLLALVICEIIGTVLARTLPTPVSAPLFMHHTG